LGTGGSDFGTPVPDGFYQMEDLDRGDVYLDTLALDGTRLWRADLGPNIRAGARYTQFVVQDFDGDGKAELAVKTAPGTRDGTGAFLSRGPAASDDDSAVYRKPGGYILTGPEDFTVFSGETGAEIGTVAFVVPRGTVSAWGDGCGNRVDRFLATAAFGAEGKPHFVMARGYYTRTTPLTSWGLVDGKIVQDWKFDSNATPKDGDGDNYTGQGSHSMAIANVDDDPGQEVMCGAMAVDHDGQDLCSTGYGHGGAEHVGDLVSSRPGLEFFMCNESWSRNVVVERRWPARGRDGRQPRRQTQFTELLDPLGRRRVPRTRERDRHERVRWRHAPKLRLVCGEQTAYSQPPHVGFHMGRGMVTPPKPDIHVR